MSLFVERINVIMDNLPLYVSLLFAATALITAYFFFRAANKSTAVLLLLFAWMTFQALMALGGFYTNTQTIPPRFLLMVLPPLVIIIILLVGPAGKNWLAKLDIKTLTLLHVVRIPVEVVLYLLFIYHKIPQLMTFEGRNADILAGISAPVIYYFVFVKKSGAVKILFWWNIVSLLLLLNIVVNAALSAPSPIQQFAFDQPNTAIFYFPFNWLPSVVVPLVLLSHLAVLQRIKRKSTGL